MGQTVILAVAAFCAAASAADVQRAFSARDAFRAQPADGHTDLYATPVAPMARMTAAAPRPAPEPPAPVQDQKEKP